MGPSPTPKITSIFWKKYRNALIISTFNYNILKKNPNEINFHPRVSVFLDNFPISHFFLPHHAYDFHLHPDLTIQASWICVQHYETDTFKNSVFIRQLLVLWEVYEFGTNFFSIYSGKPYNNRVEQSVGIGT